MKDYYELLNVEYKSPKEIIDLSFLTKGTNSSTLDTNKKLDLMEAHFILSNSKSKRLYNKQYKYLNHTPIKLSQSKPNEELNQYLSEFRNNHSGSDFESYLNSINKPNILTFVLKNFLISIPLTIIQVILLIIGVFTGDDAAIVLPGQRSATNYLSILLFLLSITPILFNSYLRVIFLLLSIALLAWEIKTLNNKYPINKRVQHII